MSDIITIISLIDTSGIITTIVTTIVVIYTLCKITKILYDLKKYLDDPFKPKEP